MAVSLPPAELKLTSLPLLLLLFPSHALQQRPPLRGGGGELPAAVGWRGPMEPQR